MIKNMSDVKPIEDTCGELRELYADKNMSVAYDILSGKAKSHMHHTTQEVYYIEKGTGILYLGDRAYQVKPGDIIPIPKNQHHHLETDNRLELMVVNSPPWNPDDVILE